MTKHNLSWQDPRTLALYKETRHFLADYHSHTSEYKKALIIKLALPGGAYENYTLDDMLHGCLIPLAIHLEQTRLLQFAHPPYTEIAVFLRYFVRHDPYLLLSNLARGTFTFPKPAVIVTEQQEFHIQLPKKPVKRHFTFSAQLFIVFLLSFTVMFGLLYHEVQQESHTSLSETTVTRNTSTSLSQQIVLPHRLIIPVLHINAAVEQVGLTTNGAMAVPSNIHNAGWYSLGPHPGETGSAVISGHYDGITGAYGVFEKLHVLKPGDTIYIENTDGKMKSFRVRESRLYNPDSDASAVFGQREGTHLNLITCDGVWDQLQKNYLKRLVVFTDEVR